MVEMLHVLQIKRELASIDTQKKRFVLKTKRNKQVYNFFFVIILILFGNYFYIYADGESVDLHVP
jgi:hypothetical protein